MEESPAPSVDSSSQQDDQEVRAKPGLAFVPTGHTFSDPDDPTNIVTDSEGELIKAASMGKLIERVTLPNTAHNLLFEILLTYRTFTSPVHFLEGLIMRFRTATGEKQGIVQLRTWVEKFWFDFEPEKASLVPILVQFAKDTSDQEHRLASPLSHLLEKIETKKTSARSQATRVPSISSPPSANIPHFSSGECDSEEIARQLTLIEQEYWTALQPRELINLAWTKSDTKLEVAPNVCALTSRFNEVSCWVKTTILTELSVKKRTKLISKFIEVLSYLDEMDNVNGVFELVSALDSMAILRLKQTVSGLSTKEWQKFEMIKEKVSQKGNKKALRDRLQTSKAIIPYLGLFLSDIYFIEEGHSNHINGLINFTKRRQLAGTIRTIQGLQEQIYNFVPVPSIQNPLRNLQYYDDEVLYSLSAYLEPRGGGPPTGRKPFELLTDDELNKAGYRATDISELNFPIDYPKDYPFGSMNPEEFKINDYHNDFTIFGGTVVRLVEFLTGAGKVNARDVRVFLAMYRDYCTPNELFDLLVARFNVPPLKASASQSQSKQFQEQIDTRIKMRVIHFIISWINFHQYDFEDDEVLWNKLVDFSQGPVRQFDTEWLEDINKALKTQHTSSDCPEVVGELPSMSVDLCMSFDFDAEELARQMCLVEHHHFSRVKPQTLLDQTLSEEDYPLSKRFALISDLVHKQVEKAKEMDKGVKCISHWCSVLSHLIEAGNWHSSGAVVAGLEKTMSEDSKSDWVHVPLAQRTKWTSVRKLFTNPQHSKLRIRMLPSLSEPPAIPLMTTIRQDLESALKTHPDLYLNPEKTVVHFARATVLSNLLTKRVTQPQLCPYKYRSGMSNVLDHLLPDPSLSYPMAPLILLSEESEKDETSQATPRDNEVEKDSDSVKVKEKNKSRLTDKKRSREKSKSKSRRRDKEVDKEKKDRDRGTTEGEKSPRRNSTDHDVVKSRRKSRSPRGATSSPEASSDDAMRLKTTSSPKKRRHSVSSSSPPPENQRLGINKEIVLDLLKNDKSFREDVKERIKAIIQDQFEGIRNEFGVPSELNVESLIMKQFPGQSVEVWKKKDLEGVVYGFPSVVSIATVRFDSNTYLCEAHSICTPNDVLLLVRLGKFYRSNNSRRSLRCVLFARSIGSKARAMAERAGIMVYLAR